MFGERGSLALERARERSARVRTPGLAPTEAARLAGVSIATLRRAFERGELRVTWDRSRPTFAPEAVLAWARERGLLLRHT